MRAAILDGERVVNVILLGEDADPEAFGAVACPDETQIGWLHRNGEFRPPVDPGGGETGSTVPATISDRQFAQVLAIDGVITQDEALAWAARGELPAALNDALDHVPEEHDQRFGARMLLAAATAYERAHPLVPLLGSLLTNPATGRPYDAPALDDIWTRGAGL